MVLLVALASAVAPVPVWSGLTYKNYEIHNVGGWDILCDTYVVRQGDHLSQLFRRRGEIAERAFPEFISIFRQINENVDDVDRIFPGQRVLIPLKKVPRGSLPSQESGEVTLPMVTITDVEWMDIGATGGPAPGTKVKQRAVPYEVAPGDSVSEIIATRYGEQGTEMNDRARKRFRELNPAVTNMNRIYVGETLYLPHPEDLLADSDGGEAATETPGRQAAPEPSAVADARPTRRETPPAPRESEPEPQPVREAEPSGDVDPDGLTVEDLAEFPGGEASPRPGERLKAPGATIKRETLSADSEAAETNEAAGELVDTYVDKAAQGGARGKHLVGLKDRTYRGREPSREAPPEPDVRLTAGTESQEDETGPRSPDMDGETGAGVSSAGSSGAGDSRQPGRAAAPGDTEEDVPAPGPGSAGDADQGFMASLPAAPPGPAGAERVQGIRGAVRQIGAELIASGVYYFPRPGSADLKLDLSQHPVARLPDGSHLLICQGTTLSDGEQAIVRKYWGPLRTMTVPRGASSEHVLRKILADIGIRNTQKQISFEDEGVKVAVRSHLILPGATANKYVAISWIADASMTTDERIREYLHDKGIGLIELLPGGRRALGNGGYGHNADPGPDQLFLDAGSCRIFVALLFQLFQVDYAENVPVSFPHEGRQVELYANLARTDDGQEFIVDFGGHGRDGELLPGLGLPVLVMEPENGCVPMAGAVMDQLGYSCEEDPVFKATENSNITTTMEIPGIMIRRGPLPPTLITSAGVDRRIVDILKERGIRVMQLKNRFCS